jgi:hypothetical protein
MHLQNQLIVVVQSRGKYSTSSPTTAPEMLASEVTPGLLAGAEPDTHQFNVTICFIKGDQMEVKTQGNIILTQGLGLVCKEQRRSGILTSASGLIKR